MAYYDLSKQQRAYTVATISEQLLNELATAQHPKTIACFQDEDTYIRKAAYTSVGKLYHTIEGIKEKVLQLLDNLLQHEDYKVRQTVMGQQRIGSRRLKRDH